MYKLAWMSACSLTHEKPLWEGNNKVCMELMANAHNTSSKWLMQSLNFGASRLYVSALCPLFPVACLTRDIRCISMLGSRNTENSG